MAFTEFYCQSTGSNLNAGSTTSDTATFSYASGSWVASTGVFTVASGNPLTDGVAVGHFASVYPDGSATAVFIGRVTARTATTITVSLTVKSGTAPTDGTNTRTLKIGGAWKGPNGAEAFPFGFISNAGNDGTNQMVRVNLKNDATYAISAGITHATASLVFQGMTTTPGDGGKATIDGSTNAIVLCTINQASEVVDLIFSNNGTTGANAGLVLSGGQSRATRCVAHHIRGHGISITGVKGVVFGCEAYLCNGSNTALTAGIHLNVAGAIALYCISHDNTGSNSSGFIIGNSQVTGLLFCIADTNGASGLIGTNDNCVVVGCDFYNNTSDGINKSNTNGAGLIANCNLVKNGGWGINGFSGAGPSGGTFLIFNCGFGSGAQTNTLGQINGLSLQSSGSVTYPTDAVPWFDAANGDFRINLAAAKGTGIGTFTQTAPSYAGTIAYPDRGAAQHQDSGGGAIFNPLAQTIIRPA